MVSNNDDNDVSFATTMTWQQTRSEKCVMFHMHTSWQFEKKRIGVTDSMAEKALLVKKSTLQATKNSDDDNDDNVAMRIKKTQQST